MRVVNMGENTDPDWLKSNKATNSLKLKAEIEKIMEEDGECRLSWSCEGRARHEMHSYHWKEAMKDHTNWKWKIDYNYNCIIKMRK